MKRLICILFVLICPFLGQAMESLEEQLLKGELKGTEIQEILQKINASKRSQDIWYLRMAKDSLTRGNTTLASYFLKQVDDSRTKLDLIKKRYLALTYFVEGKFEDSLEQLQDPRFTSIKNATNVCLLKILNKMTLKKSELTNVEFENCRDLTESYSKNDQFWLENMQQLKLKKFRAFKSKNFNDIQFVIESNELLSIWLKTAIYANQEEVVVNNLPFIPKEAYRSKRIRELIGLVFYRLGKKEKALSFIEDIESPNSENIKGNINLEKKEYELAFGHFKLALKRKENSVNALERSIPLAWLLGQWQEGRDLLHRVVDKKLDKRNKLTLDTAFLIRLNQFEKADEQLRLLNVRFKNKPPREIDMMKSYVALRLSNTFDLAEATDKNCNRFDGINCWLQLQTGIWEDLGKTITREEDISYDKEYSLESLKEKKEIVPLKEIPIIDQKDIQELDSKLVTITPGAD